MSKANDENNFVKAYGEMKLAFRILMRTQILKIQFKTLLFP